MSSASHTESAPGVAAAGALSAADDRPAASLQNRRQIGADQHGAVTIAVAVVLAVIIFAVREVLPNPDEGVTNLYAIPIAIVAVRSGAIGGAVAALMSLALFAIWELSHSDVTIGPIGYACRGAAFLVLGLIVGRFASERRALVARLAEVATSDALTGIANRAKFESEFTIELARSRRHGRSGALLLADLDGFKRINDEFGHRAGDDVLKHVANVLGEQVRATELIARIGGDEFVVLLPDTPRGDAEALATRLSDAIPESVREVAGTPITLGMSVGCAYFNGSTPNSPDELLHAADEDMYRVKASRRA